TSRVVWSCSKHSGSNLSGGAESEPGISKSRPSGKMPEALEIPSDPAVRASRLICSERKPQGRKDRLSRWNWSRFSRKRSCSWRCCGLRKVPLVQITGCSRFIWNHSSRTECNQPSGAGMLRGANPGTDSQFPANCAGNLVSVPGLRRSRRCYPLGMVPSKPEPQLSSRLLPRLGSDEEFARVRGMLAECGFTPERICERLGIAGMSEYKPIRRGRTNLLAAEEALDALILLLMDGEYLWFAGCTLFPTRGMVLGSDRAAAPDGSALPMTADAVYPAAIGNTVAFLATLPETPCDALLDIGTGTGIAALDAARYARHAWGTDIAARSVQFAEFNRRLNGIQTATMLQGDLYAPVEGITFDRIVTHPPYVPARKNTMIFRDGGEDGEQILRRIVEDVPRFLRPGGRFYTMVTAADCEGQAFEDRLRLWLGAAQAEFDLVLAAHTLTGPKDLAANSFLGQNTPVEDIRYRHEIWARRKVQFLFHGSVLMRRHERARPAFTARVLKGEGFTPRHVEWLLEWNTEVREAASLG